jgi:hypothetical protein
MRGLARRDQVLHSRSTPSTHSGRAPVSCKQYVGIMRFVAALVLLCGAASATPLDGVVRVPLYRRKQDKPFGLTEPVSSTLRSHDHKIVLRNYMDAQV